MNDINWDDRLEIIRGIKNNDISSELKYAPEHIKKDKCLIKLAVTHDYNHFEYAHEELKNDKNFIKELIRTCKKQAILLNNNIHGIIYYIDDKLLNDKGFIPELILLDNEIIEFYLNYCKDKFLLSITNLK